MQPGSDTILWDVHSPLSSNTCRIYFIYLSIHSKYAFILWNIPESILFVLKRYRSSKAMGGVPPFLRILYDDGKPERTSSIFISKTLLSLKNKHYYLDLYSPTLGTIPFGYWVSRVLGPSSKARDGTRLYT